MAWEDDDSAFDRLVVENPHKPSQQSEVMRRCKTNETHFRMVLTPTLFSAVKKMKRCSEPGPPMFVKKFS